MQVCVQRIPCMFPKHFVSYRYNTPACLWFVGECALDVCASQRQTADVTCVSEISVRPHVCVCSVINIVPSCVWWSPCYSVECDQGKPLETPPAGHRAELGFSLWAAPPLWAVLLILALWHRCMGGASSVRQGLGRSLCIHTEPENKQGIFVEYFASLRFL